MIQTFHRMWRTQGPRGILHAAARRVMRTPVSAFDAAEALVCGKTGLEIGGSSALFGRGRLLPVYPLASHIDNCNFSRRTVWEGDITEGDTFQFDSRKKPGSQYLAEAADLSLFRDAAYDFILSSHTLEHVANPLRALAEWKRVLKGEGALLLVLPHRDGTFDHRRPVTTLAHLIDDFERSTGEDDLSHLAEICLLYTSDAADDL